MEEQKMKAPSGGQKSHGFAIWYWYDFSTYKNEIRQVCVVIYKNYGKFSSINFLFLKSGRGREGNFCLCHHQSPLGLECI